MNKFIVWEKTPLQSATNKQRYLNKTIENDEYENWLLNQTKMCWYFYLTGYNKWNVIFCSLNTFLCLHSEWSDRKVIKLICDASGAIFFFFMSMKWQYVCIINCVTFRQKLSDSFFKCNRYGVCEIEDKIVAI